MALFFKTPGDYMEQLKEQTDLLLKEIHARRGAGGDGESELDLACQKIMGLSLKTVRSSSPEILLELINPGGRQADRAVLSADILSLDADIQEERGEVVNAIRSRVQAFCLLAGAIDRVGPDEQAVYRPKLDALYRALSPFDDPYLRQKLGAYQPTPVT